MANRIDDDPINADWLRVLKILQDSATREDVRARCAEIGITMKMIDDAFSPEEWPCLEKPMLKPRPIGS